MVRNDVIQHLIKEYNHLAFWENPDMHDPPRKTYGVWITELIDRPDWGYEEDGTVKREKLSEDYSFCKRLSDIGYDIFIDLQVILTHWHAGQPWKLDTHTVEEELKKNDG